MSYEDKVALLKSGLKGYVKFDSLYQAEHYASAHKEKEAWDALCACADKIFLFRRQLEVEGILDEIGGCEATRKSAIREALRLIAAERLLRHQAHLDAQLGCKALPV